MSLVKRATCTAAAWKLPRRVSSKPSPAAWAFCFMLVFELLFMISPAAVFFCSVYGPVLGFLNGAQATAWLTQFFLPHIAATGNPVLDHAHVAGGLLIVLGLIVFLAGAVPLYSSKFRHRA